MCIKFGILIFAATILLGPLYTVEGYSVTANTISELGAQRTPNNVVAIIGFVAFGLGIAIEWLRHRSWVTTPFLLFGIFIAALSVCPRAVRLDSIRGDNKAANLLAPHWMILLYCPKKDFRQLNIVATS